MNAAAAQYDSNAFNKADTDRNNGVDFDEFCKALEYLGLHIRGKGLAGLGGVEESVVQALFEKFDTSGDERIEWEEFSSALLAVEEQL